MLSRSKSHIIWCLLFLSSFTAVQAQTTSFTYQGKLIDANATQPTNGSYDIEFRLWDNPIIGQGTQQGPTLTNPGVQVTNGIFTVNLDFGSAPFGSGPNLYLEIAIRLTGGQVTYSTLAPRQQFTSSPYAIQSMNSATATTAKDSTQLGGIPASQYVLTEDLRLSNARDPLPNSPNYIQNTSLQQPSSNFNVSGNGTAAGTLSANVLNAVTQVNIGSTRVLSAPGNGNFFGGPNAGASNSTGQWNSFYGNLAGNVNNTGNFNSFFGYNAGAANLGASDNSFFGQGAGFKNISGQGNAFFGSGAGQNNTTADANTFIGRSAGFNNSTGGGNSFFGNGSGVTNTIGSNITLVGTSANVGANNLSFATAIGAGSVVSADNTLTLGRAADTVQIPGSLNVSGTFTANIFNALTQYNIAGNRMLSSGGTNNIFAGNGSGQANTTGQANAFFGALAGTANLGGSFNSFFGYNAGAANTDAINNAFFGQGAGFKTNTGSNNTFLGNGAGLNNTNGPGNTFVGSLAGQGTVGGGNNTFVGVNAGTSNVGSSSNTFLGANAGNSNLPSSGNTYIGADADGAFLVTNATAIGQKAFAGQSNSLVLGGINGINAATADTSVGIGTTTPAYRFHVLNNSDQSVLIESNAARGAGIEFKSNRAITHNWSIYTGDNQNFGYNLFFMDRTTNSVVMSLRGDPAGGGTVNFDGIVANTIFMSTPPADGDPPLCLNSNILRITRCSNLRSPSTDQKKDIRPFTGGLSLIDQLKPISFRWNSEGKPAVSFDANEVAKIDPALVTYDSKGEIADVGNGQISAVLVNAVKEQQLQISAQNSQIELLRKQIEELRKTLAAIVSANKAEPLQPK